jgi:hypothetical protein
MSRLRFATARGVYEAFPTAQDDVGLPPTDDPPMVFLADLAASSTPEAAISFAAYILPRRECVWWAAQCVRTLVSTLDTPAQRALKAAEDWVREPDESLRVAAAALGASNDRNHPATWVACAAGWSGGSLSDAVSVPPPPALTAKGARIAVLIALASAPADMRAQALAGCLEKARKILVPAS